MTGARYLDIMRYKWITKTQTKADKSHNLTSWISYKCLDCLPWPGLKVGWRELLDESEPLLKPWFSCAMSALATLPSSNMDMAETKDNYRDCYRTIIQNGCSHLQTGIQYRWYITTNTGANGVWKCFTNIPFHFAATGMKSKTLRKGQGRYSVGKHHQ